MKQVPRMAWVLLGGIVALIAVFFLTTPPGNEVSARSSKLPLNRGGRRVEVISSTTADEILAPAKPPRTLASYNNLRTRDLFKPLVGMNTPIEGLIPLPDAPLGLMPAGIPGLPPSGSGLFNPLGENPALPSQKTLGPWSYVGYLSVDGVPGAVLENKAKHEGRSVQAGEKVEGATVIQITRENIRLQRNGKSFLLLLADPQESQKSGTPPAAPGNKAGSSPGSPAQPSPPSPGSPGSPPAGPTPGKSMGQPQTHNAPQPSSGPAPSSETAVIKRSKE